MSISFSINKGQKKQYVYDESSLDRELESMVADRKARGVAVDENACTFVIQDERNRNYALLSDRALTMTQVDDSIINIWTQDKVE